MRLFYLVALGALVTVPARGQTVINPQTTVILPGVPGSPATNTLTLTGTGSVAISSIAISCGTSCTVGSTAPAQTTIGTITVTTTIGTFAGFPLLVPSGGSCSGGDTVRFQIVNGNGVGPPNPDQWLLQTTVNPPASGSYHVCAEAYQGFATNSPQFLQINITVI